MWSEKVLASSFTTLVWMSEAIQSLNVGPSSHGMPEPGSAFAHSMAEARVGVMWRFSGRL